MTNSYYKITLTPVDKFFFGGDLSFSIGEDEKSPFNRQYASYIIQSSRFPQQTSLLGMLRFLILRNSTNGAFKGNSIVDPSKANELIGSNSFSVTDGKTEGSFGKIKSISHVRILRSETNGETRRETELEFAPLFGTINFADSIKEGSYNLGQQSIPRLSEKQYDAKDGLDTLLIPLAHIDNYFQNHEGITRVRKEREKNNDENNVYEQGVTLYKPSDIFLEDRRIGIARSIKTGRPDDGALFKQISYRFNNKKATHSFVFYAKVDDIDLTQYDKQMVTIGGDNSQFIIGITKEVDPSKDKSSESKDSSSTPLALSLLSPAFITREVVKGNTSFAITQLMPFRFLTDREADDLNQSYHILNSRLKRSGRYELYAPGTVFYFNDDKKRDSFIEALTARKDFIKVLTARKDFIQIGYNEYNIINKY